MRIIIIGAGAVGFHLAERLSEEEQDVVVIDNDPRRAERIGDQLDVLAIAGNGASVPVLEEAGTADAALFLAVTNRDEVNIIACLAADMMGAGNTVARLSDPEFYLEGSVLSQERLGIDLMINPEREAAWETYQLLGSEAATELVRFAEGRVQLIGLRVLPDAPVAGKSIEELDRELVDTHFTTVAVSRDGETQIPRGATTLEAGDHVFLVVPSSELQSIPPLAGYDSYRLRRVMIAGGSQEAVYLAKYLAQHGVACTIIDMDRARCVDLSEQLPNALVLHGDATDLELLEMEGVSDVDGFVAYTNRDSTNMLSSLLAKASGARKVVSLLHNFRYIPLVTRVGIDAAVSPRLSAVNTILRYLHHGNVSRVVTLKGIEAEAIEVRIGARSRALGTPLRDLELPDSGVVGAIIRRAEVITPRGDDAVQQDDRVILFAMPSAMQKLENMFA
jgi:trk system potassium uptake protein TrkA